MLDSIRRNLVLVLLQAILVPLEALDSPAPQVGALSLLRFCIVHCCFCLAVYLFHCTWMQRIEAATIKVLLIGTFDSHILVMQATQVPVEALASQAQPEALASPAPQVIFNLLQIHCSLATSQSHMCMIASFAVLPAASSVLLRF